MSIGTGAIIITATLVAQGSAGPQRATLLQLSLAIPKTGAAEHHKVMVEESAKITSCAEGMKLVDRLKARGLHGTLSFNVRTNVPIAALPAPLRDALLTQPIGHATPVFGAGEALRVLVRCEPSFVVPRPVAPSQHRPTTPTA